MKYFMNEYNNFENEMNLIHIAGTNGKGSCTEMIANILVKQGYKVGKYMSPHLIKFNERISINGKEITDSEMEDLIKELKPKIENYKKNKNTEVTLFELETTMALLYFYRNKVDFAVLETGLGGLYDCTNIISKPLVSVITSIGYDHMHILGNTLPEIAYQKAGIIKRNSNTVIFEQETEVNDVFIEECDRKKNKLHIVTKDSISNYRFNENYQYFDYKELKDVCINLKGKVQIQNASLCIETIRILRELGYKISDESLRKGLSTVIHKGRMEIINREPIIIYDGAHNEPAIKNFLEMINLYYKNKKRRYIISILKRKDYQKMIKLLSQDKDAVFILTSGNDDERYTSKEELYNIAIKYKAKDKIFKKDLKQAITHIMNTENDTINFVIGSFYTYGTVMGEISNLKIKL